MFSHPDLKYGLDIEIAGISISLRSFQEWECDPSFIPFMKNMQNPDYSVVFREVERLPALSDAAIHEDACYRVHRNQDGSFLRSFFDAPRDYTPYAVAQYDHNKGVIQIDCLPKGRHCVSELHNSFFHIDFEEILIHKKRLCLHAACVDTPLGGLLFSGPSGIGKSTQAELWCNYRGAKLINGDRPILSKESTAWYAWGSPYSGSSKCHVNANCPITAIVILDQSDSCKIRKLSQLEAFKAIWSGLTIHTWDRWFVEEASSLLMHLIEEIPVFKFSCTPDIHAVDYLESEIRKECCLCVNKK